MKRFLAIGFLLKSMIVFGQHIEKSFVPLPVRDTISPSIHQRLKERLLKDKENVTLSGKAGAYMKNLYEERFNYVVKSFNEDFMMFDDPIQQKLNAVLNKIYEANPQLPREVFVYGFRSEAPNAVSFGDGTICIMLGLLERLETEDELAFVICHELAHYYQKHSDKRFEELAKLNYDNTLKKQISAVRSSPYRQYSKLKAIFNGLGMSLTRHSRGSENEADSVGLTYFLKTSYNPLAAIRTMQILDKADKGPSQQNIDFKKHFDFKEFPFKPAWISYSKSDIVYAPLTEDGDSDTLKTHPNCQKRIARLKRQLKVQSLDSAQLTEGVPFTSIADISAFEMINSHDHFKQYGKSLFRALLLMERFPENVYLHAKVPQSLYRIYKAQKDHQPPVVDLPNARADENYDRFVTFVHNLRTFELAALSYHYATTRKPEYYAYEDMIYSLWLCSRFEFSKMSADKLVDDYKQLFPSGKYLQEMLTLNK